MICRHAFKKLNDISKQRDGSNADFKSSFVEGIAVLCVKCGQHRRIYADGQIVIVVEGDANQIQEE